MTDKGSKPEILSRTAQTAALTRLKLVWNARSISFSSKIRLKCSLVAPIFLYACESWLLTTELQRRIQATEMKCHRQIQRISYKDHVANKEVHAKIQQANGPHEDLLTIVKRPTQTEVVWTSLPFTRSDHNHLESHSERGKKTRRTEVQVKMKVKVTSLSDWALNIEWL